MIAYNHICHTKFRHFFLADPFEKSRKPWNFNSQFLRMNLRYAKNPKMATNNSARIDMIASSAGLLNEPQEGEFSGVVEVIGGFVVGGFVVGDFVGGGFVVGGFGGGSVGIFVVG